MKAKAGMMWCLAVALAAASVLLMVHGASAQETEFTIERALSAPYTSDLIAAPSKGRFAWVANIDGRRNLWIADPTQDGKGHVSRQVTHYADDDGQEIHSPQWAPDGSYLVYVRGSGAQGEDHPVPNPAWLPHGAQQQLWVVSAEGGEPRLLGDGQGPAICPDGKQVDYMVKGQIWTIRLDDPKASPTQVLETRGSAQSLRWSPDGMHLAFVSDRGDHSFVAVYSAASGGTVSYRPSSLCG